jgi:hypothetical protein
MEIFGLPLGIVSLFAVLMSNRWPTFGLASTCVLLAFVGLWVATNPSPCGDIGTDVQLRMCQQSHSVWDAYRLLPIGLPALLVLIVWGFRFKRLASER